MGSTTIRLFENNGGFTVANVRTLEGLGMAEISQSLACVPPDRTEAVPCIYIQLLTFTHLVRLRIYPEEISENS